MRVAYLIATLVCGIVAARGADRLAKYEHWVTGEVFFERGTLLFRADKRIEGNTRGSVVLLAAHESGSKVLMPIYQRAAAKHARLRLYGVFIATPDDLRRPGLPTTEFVTWKSHLPSDPDELPARDKLSIGPNDIVDGSKIIIHTNRCN